jgi:hypothetical protein
MHPAIHFKSRLFDVAREPENPINPIRGTSPLEWLRAHVPAHLWQCLLPRLRIGAGTLTLIDEYGHIALVVDTEGNMIGLHSMQQSWVELHENSATE